MDQTQYKTAEELGIEPWELETLKDLELLLRHGQPFGGEIRELALDMQMPTDWTDDGRTSHCIGGHVAAFNGGDVSHYIGMFADIGSYSKSLQDLYFPTDQRVVGISHHPAWTATNEQAADAIRNKLTTGLADWGGVTGVPL